CSSAMTGHSVLGVRQMFLARVTVSKDPPELNVCGHGSHGQALQRRRGRLRTRGQPDHTRVRPGVRWSSGASHGPPGFDRVRDSLVCIGTCGRAAEYARCATVGANATARRLTAPIAAAPGAAGAAADRCAANSVTDAVANAPGSRGPDAASAV